MDTKDIELRLFLMVLCFVSMLPAILMGGTALRLAALIKRRKRLFVIILYPTILWLFFSIYLYLSNILNPNGFETNIILVTMAFGSADTVIIAIFVCLFKREKLGKLILLYIFLAILITPSTPLAAIMSFESIVNSCEALHIETGNRLIQAIETYKKDNNAYPQNLDELIPRYIDASEINTCLKMHSKFVFQTEPLNGGFSYKNCTPGEVQLNIPIMGLTGHYHVYDFGDKSWFDSDEVTYEEHRRLMECNPIFPERISLN